VAVNIRKAADATLTRRFIFFSSVLDQGQQITGKLPASSQQQTVGIFERPNI